MAKLARLKPSETVRALSLEPTPFSSEEGLLTPTSKLRRQALKKKFQKTIDSMFKALS